MKNFLIALNVVLVVAVATLFYLFYSNKKVVSVSQSGTQISDSASPSSFKIAYFESDSLEKQYEYYKEVRNALRKKDEDNVGVLTGLRNKFNTRMRELQQRGSSLTQNEQASAQQELGQMEQEYGSTQQQQQQDMQAESMRRLQDVRSKIQDFLKDYAKEKGYIFVFGSNEFDMLYYKDSARDITTDVVRLLNEKYKTEKAAKK